MGLFSGMLGNAAEIDIDEIQEELAPVLATDENVTNAYKLIREMIIFTIAFRLKRSPSLRSKQQDTLIWNRN
jgi:hypothetical protein